MVLVVVVCILIAVVIVAGNNVSIECIISVHHAPKFPMRWFDYISIPPSSLWRNDYAIRIWIARNRFQLGPLNFVIMSSRSEHFQLSDRIWFTGLLATSDEFIPFYICTYFYICRVRCTRPRPQREPKINISRAFQNITCDDYLEFYLLSFIALFLYDIDKNEGFYFYF